MTQKYSNLEIGKINRNRIYRFIYFSEEQVTSSLLSKELNLSRPTVETNIKDLVESGLVQFGNLIASTGGRKPKSLNIVATVKQVVGLSITYKHVRATIVDLLGNPIIYKEHQILFENTAAYYRRINDIIMALIKEAAVQEKDILGVGIALPGPINRHQDKVIYAPSLANSHIELRLLKEVIELPVNVINDVKAVGMANHFLDNQAGKNTVFLNIERGVGGFICTDKGKYEGDDGIAGEFGHMKIVPNGKKCHCNQSGCLEAYLSTACLSDELGLTMKEFFKKLAGGDKKITGLWQEYLNYLAIGIANIYTIFNCTVVIGGSISSHLHKYKLELSDLVRKYIPFNQEATPFQINDYDEKEVVIGSTIYFINKYVDAI